MPMEGAVAFAAEKVSDYAEAIAGQSPPSGSVVHASRHRASLQIVATDPPCVNVVVTGPT